jgi:hypothetical protein
MRRTAAVAGALVAALAGAATTARAEPVLDLAQGTAPAAVTDAAGTLHVVWRDTSVLSKPLRYCRVAAGASTCSPVVDIASGVGSEPHLLLRPQDGVLIALYVSDSDDDALDDATTMVASADGGATWGAPAIVGFEDVESIDRAVLSPDGSAVDTVTSLGRRVVYQRVPLGGGVERRTVDLGPKEDVLVPRVTHLPDGRPLVIAHYADDVLGERAPAPGADPSDPRAWGAFRQWRTLRDADASAVDSGPTGTWMLATITHRTRSGGLPVRIWRWGARGFEDPRTIGALNQAAGQDVGESAGSNDLALDSDLAGRLHAAWEVAPRGCRGQHCIVYRRTDRRGFGPPIVYPIGSASGDVQRRFAITANSGGSGWIVWGTHSNRIRAVPLVTPPLGSRVGSRRIGRRRVTVPDFYGCVPSGGTFVHRLRVDGRRGAQILSVRFFFDAGEPARTDRRAPYSLRFRLTFPPGSRHVAGAIVRYRLPGRQGVRSVRLGRTFVMC